MNAFATQLVSNLKSLNAKERDHLMRFAYLGATAPYEDATGKWISCAMENALREQTAGLDLRELRCVFAAMDYHLDWLFAALYSACKGQKIDSQTGPMNGVGYGPDKSNDDIALEDPSFWPIVGNQQDVDMLLVFADQNETRVVFVEAKGVSGFNRVQLGRKLIRLDRIWAASGASKRRTDLTCKMLLTAPKQQDWKSFEEHAKKPTGRRSGDHAKKPTVKPSNDHAKVIQALELLNSSIGKEFNFLLLPGFPTELSKVVRERADGAEFTHWRIHPRP